ncbi:hypothetical protein T03_6785, partial [Trichinella britovi]
DTNQNADGTKQNNRREKCISLVHIVSRHRLEFILSKKFHCTKTGFQRCVMQITIAIKGALSYEQRRKEKAKTRVIRRASRSRTTRNGSRTARSRTRKDKRYMRFPVGPN